MMIVPLPRLLDSSGQTVGFVRPIRESITLNMTPLSYATMELPVGESLPERSFVELNTAIGTAGVFRVRAPQEAYGEDVTLVELEHAIVEVGDWLIRENLEGTFAAGTAMQRVFSHYRGTHWQLGSVSALTGTVELKAGYSRILDVMLDIVARCEGCMLTFDFSSHPWTVSVVQKGSAVAAEGRLSRNISSARISYDDTDLCTRAYYPIPSTNAETGEVTHTWGSVDADTISTYGVAEKAVFDENDTTAAECLATAQKYIEKYKRPKFSIQITGEELAARTGESLDSFEVGKLFRLALADYNVTVEENITVLSWEDVYGSPTAVNITLAEEETDTVSYIHDLDVSGSTVSSGSTKDVDGKVKTIYSSRTVNNEVDLVKIKANAAGEILAQAGMSIDPETGVIVYATDNVRNVGAMLQVQADRIGMVVGSGASGNFIKAAEIATAINDAGEGIATINAAKVNISATSTLHTLAGAIEEDDQGNVTIKSAGGMRVRKTVSGQVAEFGVFDENSLTAGVIVDRVNGGSVTIKGSKVWVGDAASDQTLKKWATESDGLFAQNIGALSARIGTIEADYITTNNISSTIAGLGTVTVQSIRGSAATFTSGDISSLSSDSITADAITVSNGSLTLGNTPLSAGNLVKSVVGSPVTGGGYKFTVTQANGASQDYSFNTASSLTFSGAWAGASYTATAKDADDNVLGSVTTAISKRWNGSDLLVESGNDTLLTESMSAHVGTGNLTTGGLRTIDTFNSSHKAYGYVIGNSMSNPLFTFNVDASGEYTAGQTAGRASVTLSAAGWQGGSNVVSASNGESVTVSMPAVTMSSGNWASHKKTVYAYSSEAGISGYIASHEVDATTEYNSGVTAGNTAAGVTSSWSGNTFTVTRAANTSTKSLSCIITITPNSAKTLGYGESVTVKALGNASEKASVTITAPADRYQTGYNAGWAAARAKISRSGAKIMVPPATVDGAAVEGYNITVVQGGISASRITSSNYALSASSSAYINGTAVATDSTSRNLSV